MDEETQKQFHKARSLIRSRASWRRTFFLWLICSAPLATAGAVIGTTIFPEGSEEARIFGWLGFLVGVMVSAPISDIISSLRYIRDDLLVLRTEVAPNYDEDESTAETVARVKANMAAREEARREEIVVPPEPVTPAGD